MNWNDFFTMLSAGSVENAYLFTGPEDFVKREAMEKLRAALLPPGLEALNENILEGTDAAHIVEAAETLPMMCDRRLVVVRDWGPLMGGKSRDEENETRRILQYLDSANSGCCLVFYMRQEADARKKLAAEMNKRGLTVDFAQLTEAEIVKWIASQLKKRQKKISAACARQLIFTAGRELTRLSGEIEKLSAYSGQRAEITQEDIEEVVSPSLDFGAFDMLNHLFDGDSAGAYRILQLMLERGGNQVAILASITRQLRGMTHLRLAAGGSSVAETAKLLNLNPYAAKIMAQKAGKYAPEALESLYLEAVNADADIKSGRMRDSAALDRLFIKISCLSPEKRNQTRAPSVKG